MEVMLRQMLENGLGQREETHQERLKKKRQEELDNSFDLNGIPDTREGKEKNNSEYTKTPGHSEFLQRSSGKSAEHWSPTNAGRQGIQTRIICLTCETECDRKKQWKITE